MRSLALRFRPARLASPLCCLALCVPFSNALGQDPKPEAAAAPVQPETVTRPELPEIPPDADELKLRPDSDGKLKFNFQGQPWSAVVEWLAEVSGLSLDWQELPAGFLNLRTQQSYSVEEARDLINRHLLDRGFTLLKDGEILSVMKITKLDPSLVPRLEPDELLDAMPHDFVRVTFPSIGSPLRPPPRICVPSSAPTAN
ncbi:MAG: hypothetical protein NT069_03450 [Planctomycetota bacterium]|nr:hypothetical protein [Planctomycetota bacterium]